MGFVHFCTAQMVLAFISCATTILAAPVTTPTVTSDISEQSQQLRQAPVPGYNCPPSRCYMYQYPPLPNQAYPNPGYVPPRAVNSPTSGSQPQYPQYPQYLYNPYYPPQYPYYRPQYPYPYFPNYPYYPQAGNNMYPYANPYNQYANRFPYQTGK